MGERVMAVSRFADEREPVLGRAFPVRVVTEQNVVAAPPPGTGGRVPSQCHVAPQLGAKAQSGKVVG